MRNEYFLKITKYRIQTNKLVQLWRFYIRDESDADDKMRYKKPEKKRIYSYI